MASERLTEPLWQEVGKYKGILDTAQSADGIVRQKFDANRRGIEQVLFIYIYFFFLNFER